MKQKAASTLPSCFLFHWSISLSLRKPAGRERGGSSLANVVLDYAEVADVYDTVVVEVRPGIVCWFATARAERRLQDVEVADVHKVVVIGVTTLHKAHIYLVYAAYHVQLSII